MQEAAQEITDDNFGESVPLTGCEMPATAGSPFSGDLRLHVGGALRLTLNADS